MFDLRSPYIFKYYRILQNRKKKPIPILYESYSMTKMWIVNQILVCTCRSFVIRITKMSNKHNILRFNTASLYQSDIHIIYFTLKEYYEIVDEASIRICSHTCWLFYWNAFIIMKLSKLPSFRVIRAVIASQSTFDK